MDNKETIKKSFLKAKENNKPKPKYVRNGVFAFLVGGFICTTGQIITDICYNNGISYDKASILTTIILVFIGSFLTSVGVYDKIGKVAGAGSIVPITGFANSVVACAMEFKSEGIVFGIGAKMFNIAGPVIVYGTVGAWIVGIIYYIITVVM